MRTHHIGGRSVDSGPVLVLLTGQPSDAAIAAHAVAPVQHTGSFLLTVTVASRGSWPSGRSSTDPAAATTSTQASPREVACVRGSDVTVAGGSVHMLQGIGRRRTWVKASRPDLCGLRHAYADPELRVSLQPPSDPDYTVIETVRVTGGFPDGHTFGLSADLNCLLDGTGTGKSLLIQVIRFALDQQTDGANFPQVRTEVDSRLHHAFQNAPPRDGRRAFRR